MTHSVFLPLHFFLLHSSDANASDSDAGNILFFNFPIVLIRYIDKMESNSSPTGKTTCNIECMSLLPLKVTISINYHKCSVAAVLLLIFRFFMNSTIPLDIDKSLKEIVIMANDNDMNSMLIHINES